MGVVGLTTLINENRQLFTPAVLCNQLVVIDGSSLYHQLYFHHHLDCRHSGDYDLFYDVCTGFFKSLARVKIDPVIVIDGMIDCEGAKLSTLISRQRKRMEIAKVLNVRGRGALIPLQCFDVFVRCVKDNGIKFLSCPGEADGVIASLGKRWNCPIMSQDSDFFIFDLPAGYVPFDELEWDDFSPSAAGSPRAGIRCGIYFVEELLACFPGFKTEVLPVFATVAGNDFASSGQFAKFYNQVPMNRLKTGSKRGKKQGKRLLKSCQRQEKLIGVLNWFKEFDNTAEALCSVLQFIEKSKHNRIKNDVNRNVKIYSGLELDYLPTVLADSLNISKELLLVRTILRSQFEDFPDLTNSIIDCYESLSIFPVAVNLIVTKKILFMPLLEKIESPNCYNCANRLRNFFYRVCFRFANNSALATNLELSEYKRAGGNFRKFNRRMDLDLEEDLDVQIQSSISSGSGIPLNWINVQPCWLMDIHESLRHFVAVTLYWINQTSSTFSFSFLGALLLNAIVAVIADGMTSDGNVAKDAPVALRLLNTSSCSVTVVDQSACQKLIDIIRKFTFSGDYSRKNFNQFDIEVVHLMNEWQVCYQTALWTRQVLALSHAGVQEIAPMCTFIHKFFNGRRIYNLTCYIRSHVGSPKNANIKGTTTGVDDGGASFAGVEFEVILRSLFPNPHLQPVCQIVLEFMNYVGGAVEPSKLTCQRASRIIRKQYRAAPQECKDQTELIDVDSGEEACDNTLEEETNEEVETDEEYQELWGEDNKFAKLCRQ